MTNLPETCEQCGSGLREDGTCSSGPCRSSRPTPTETIEAKRRGCAPVTLSGVTSASGAHRLVMKEGAIGTPRAASFTPTEGRVHYTPAAGFHAVKIPSASDQTEPGVDAPDADPRDLPDFEEDNEKTITTGPPDFDVPPPLPSDPVATIPPPEPDDPNAPTEVTPDEADTLRPPPPEDRAGSGIRRAVHPGDDADEPNPKTGDGTG